jgi:hypothetical protein
MVIKTKLTNDILKVYLPLRNPKVSASGKNIVIATTRGPAGTDVEYEGQEILVVANAFIKNSEHQARRTEKLK